MSGPPKKRPPAEETSSAAVTLEMPVIGAPSMATATLEMEAVEDPAGMTLETELPAEWAPPEPPEADAVAWRALVVGALLRRLELEERLARGKDGAAEEEIQRLQQWVDEEGLFTPLSFTGPELFEAGPGAWSEEERQAVGWSAEELHLLLWALKQTRLPPMEARVEVAPLLACLPLLKDPQPFLESAERRSLEEVEAQMGRWQVLLDCARHESFARGIQAEPELAQGAPELEALLESAEAEGFERGALEAQRGKVRAAVEGLRFWTRFLVTQLQQQGLLPGKAGEGLMFQGQRLAEMDEATLATLLGLAYGRCQALTWLLEGEPAAPEEEEDEEPG